MLVSEILLSVTCSDLLGLSDILCILWIWTKSMNKIFENIISRELIIEILDQEVPYTVVKTIELTSMNESTFYKKN